MDLTVGKTLYSTVDATVVIVIRVPAGPVAVTCGGTVMTIEKPGAAISAPAPDAGAGTLLGKRYADETLGIELLCTKAGAGTLAVNGVQLLLKAAKALPASD